MNGMGEALPWNGRYSEGPTHAQDESKAELPESDCLPGDRSHRCSQIISELPSTVDTYAGELDKSASMLIWLDGAGKGVCTRGQLFMRSTHTRAIFMRTTSSRSTIHGFNSASDQLSCNQLT